jgi:hypothetical protein
MDHAIERARQRAAAPGRLWIAGASAGVIGGVAMGMFMMIQSAATGNGFWTPLEVCMASFVYRAEARTMEHMLMMHPGMGMAEPLNGVHVLVGGVLHLAFSVVVGVVFAGILFLLARAGLSIIRSFGGFVAASIGGAAMLYFVMMYLVLPWANPPMCRMTPRGPFFIGHLIFGLAFGMAAYPLGARQALE